MIPWLLTWQWQKLLTVQTTNFCDYVCAKQILTNDRAKISNSNIFDRFFSSELSTFLGFVNSRENAESVVANVSGEKYRKCHWKSVSMKRGERVAKNRQAHKGMTCDEQKARDRQHFNFNYLKQQPNRNNPHRKSHWQRQRRTWSLCRLTWKIIAYLQGDSYALPQLIWTPCCDLQSRFHRRIALNQDLHPFISPQQSLQISAPGAM